MSKRVIIIGAGGHAKVIADIVIKSGDDLLGFLDDSRVEDVLGYPILGKVSDIVDITDRAAFVMGIGSNQVRKEIHNNYKVKWYIAIHPSACIGTDVFIGEGTVVMAHATVNTGAKIGRHCIINTGAVIEHDNVLEDYVHISPGVFIGGTVSIGECSHIGIGAVIRNNLNITRSCTVGAGAVVVKDITETGVFVGAPAVKMEY